MAKYEGETRTWDRKFWIYVEMEKITYRSCKENDDDNEKVEDEDDEGDYER